jgi:hypothetical protein
VAKQRNVQNRKPNGRAITQLTTYVNPDFKLAVQVEARRSGMSVSLWVEETLHRALADSYTPGQAVAAMRAKGLVDARTFVDA